MATYSLANLHFQFLPSGCPLLKAVSSVRCHNCATFISIYPCDYSQFSPLLVFLLLWTTPIQSRQMTPSKSHSHSNKSWLTSPFFRSISEFQIHNLQCFIIRAHTSSLLGSHTNITSPTGWQSSKWPSHPFHFFTIKTTLTIFKWNPHYICVNWVNKNDVYSVWMYPNSLEVRLYFNGFPLMCIPP